MPKLALLVVALAMACSVVWGYKCGRNDLEQNLASFTVSVHCQPKLQAFNKCCYAHDKCYDKQLGRAKCDRVFCTCVNKAAAGNPLCKSQSDLFCNLVKGQDDVQYNKSKRRHG